VTVMGASAAGITSRPSEYDSHLNAERAIFGTLQLSLACNVTNGCQSIQL
jgi:hypothetical protein